MELTLLWTKGWPISVYFLLSNVKVLARTEPVCFWVHRGACPEPMTKPVCRRVWLVRPLPHAACFIASQRPLETFVTPPRSTPGAPWEKPLPTITKSWCKIVSCKQCLAFSLQLGQNLLRQFLLPRSAKKSHPLTPCCVCPLIVLSFFSFYSFFFCLVRLNFWDLCRTVLMQLNLAAFLCGFMFRQVTASPMQGLDISQ